MGLYNTIAETYDAIRPGYPVPLIADIVEAGNLSEASKLMEIGAGTGKATIAFLSQGFSIDANEISPEMAEILRRKASTDRLTLSVCPFEDWSPPQHKYDCIYCGQAFHWLDKTVKFQKCSEYLNGDGLLALFWYDPMPQALTEAHIAAKQVKEDYLGVENIITSVPMNTRLQEIEETPYFDLIERKSYQVVLRNTAEQSWAAMESTPAFQEKFGRLRSSERTAFRREYIDTIENHGGYTETTMLYSLYLLKPSMTSVV